MMCARKALPSLHRFTVSESVCWAIQHRLPKLNHERCVEEVMQGLHWKRGGAGGAGKKAAAGGKSTLKKADVPRSKKGLSLFDEDGDEWVMFGILPMAATCPKAASRSERA